LRRLANIGSWSRTNGSISATSSAVNVWTDDGTTNSSVSKKMTRATIEVSSVHDRDVAANHR